MPELTVFLAGALVMVLEMSGARVLAPHVGTSAIVWTSLIGVVLACLALGSWAGGRIADKKLSSRTLAFILTCAGLGCALTAFAHQAIGSAISGTGNLYISAVLGAIFIYALPAFFFGMITPYVIRLKLANLSTAGATVGRLYALSTTGSIIGTFLGGFVLISWLSSTLILWGLACCLFLLSLANSPGKPWLRLIILAIAAFLAWQDQAFARWQAEKGGVRLFESPYNSLRIMEGVDHSRGSKSVRLMATDPGYTQSGMLKDDPSELYFDYTRFYALGSAFVPDARSVLMLGGGGYSVPKWLLSKKSPLGTREDLEVTVIELDPLMTESAKKFFNLPDDKRLQIIHADARAFLNRQRAKYDLVFVDVFNSHYSIPFQMGTAEAVAKMREAISDDGALVMNLISAVEGEDGRLFRSIFQNLANEFEEVRIYCVGQPENPEKIQNLMLVALPVKKAEPALENFRANGLAAFSPDRKEVLNMARHLYKGQPEKDVPPLTDEYAPVERYTLMLSRP